MRLVVNHGLDWALRGIPKVVDWMGEAKSIAAMEGDRIMGVVVYDAFTPHECCMHIVIEDRKCVTREVLKEVFSYPFEQLGLRRVTGLVAESNTASLTFSRRLGFRHEGRKRLALGDEDEIVLGMTREMCPWL